MGRVNSFSPPPQTVMLRLVASAQLLAQASASTLQARGETGRRCRPTLEDPGAVDARLEQQKVRENRCA